MSLPKPKLVANLNLPTLVRIFEDITNCLDGINTFATGAEWNINNFNHLTYPILFLEIPNSISFDLQNNIKTIDFNFYILTQAIEGASGERIGLEPTFNSFWAELSQMEMKVTNVIQILKENYFGNFPRDFEIRLIPKMTFAEDNTYGWVVGMQLILNRELDNCDIIYKEESCGPILLPGGGGDSNPAPCPAACLTLIEQLSQEITELLININQLQTAIINTDNNLNSLNNNFDQFTIDTNNQFQSVNNNLINLQNQINNINVNANNQRYYPSNDDLPQLKVIKPYIESGNFTTGILTNNNFILFRFNTNITITGYTLRIVTNPNNLNLTVALYNIQFNVNNLRPIPFQQLFTDTLINPAPGVYRVLLPTPINITAGDYYIAITPGLSLQGSSRVDTLLYNGGNFAPLVGVNTPTGPLLSTYANNFNPPVGATHISIYFFYQ
jgi:hypothetical protein